MMFLVLLFDQGTGAVHLSYYFLTYEFLHGRIYACISIDLFIITSNECCKFNTGYRLNIDMTHGNFPGN